jgi:putative DNA primase/helicase
MRRRDRFSINTQKQVFNCRGCGKGGDVIDLVQHIDGVDFVTACTTLTHEAPPRTNGHATDNEFRAAEFIYHDEDGKPIFKVVRIEQLGVVDGKRKKAFKQRRPDPEKQGAWLPNVDNVRVVPYRLPELLKAKGEGRVVFIVEGEAKADLLWSWGMAATCNAMGAGKWRSEHSEFFNGADVVILPDN